MVEDLWHFTPVIELNSCLSSGAKRLHGIEQTHLPSESPPNLLSSDDHQNPPGLGNFDKIWRFLKVPLSAPPAKLESKLEVAVATAPSKDLGDQLGNKGVRWWDGTKSADLADKEAITDHILANGIVKPLTKKERRTKNRAESTSKGLKEEVPVKEEVPQDTPKKNKLRLRPRPRSATEAVIQQILSDSLAVPNPPSPVSRIKKKKHGATSDHEKQPVTPPAVSKQLIVELNGDGQSADRFAAKRREQLIEKLRATFPVEQKFLKNISALPPLDASTNNIAQTIHVFVDVSNIMIGFQWCIRRALFTYVTKRKRAPPFSFHNFALILERGRPAAKRVLAGSANVPAIQEAKSIGYETNILDRVHKARELTPRKLQFIKNGMKNSDKTTRNAFIDAAGQPSTPETAATGFARQKWVEQAVDEILHLKMLESVVDARTPSTIVLATGDAAAAEYSEGFFKMVERALEKGWRVELVSFKHNIGSAYMHRPFRQKWEGRFKIIALDEFVESLVGSPVNSMDEPRLDEWMGE